MTPNPPLTKPKRLALPAAFALAVALSATFLSACQPAQQIERFSGPTMGSTYHISYVRSGKAPNAAALAPQVQTILSDIDAAISTYRDDSALVRFNAAEPGCMDMPAIALQLAEHARQLARTSEGAFDVTLLPVLQAWGFGHGKKTQSPEPAAPTEDALQALRARIGIGHLRVQGQQLCKDAPIHVEFNSIAAGYAVDRIADMLAAQGIASYLVEVTGEIRGAGRKPGGAPWLVAIEAPLETQEGARQAQKIVALDGLSLSTSGDYCQYREVDGQRQTHLIDPQTLRPIQHRLAAVTVATPSAMQADGLSTLLMVLGPERGYDFAVQRGIAALFVERAEATGAANAQTPTFTTRSTPAFDTVFAQGEKP